MSLVVNDQDNRPLNTNSSDKFNVRNYLNLSSIQTDLSNDFKFRVTVTADINDAENFDGCGSNFTDIILRINGLPSVAFDNINNNDTKPDQRHYYAGRRHNNAVAMLAQAILAQGRMIRL